MVGPTAGAHSRLLEAAQPWGGLAGVPDAGGTADCGGVDEGAGPGGDAREVPQEVQRRALRREDRRQGPAHRGERLARSDGVAVVHVPRERHGRVDLGEGLGGAGTAGDDTRVAGHEGRVGGEVVGEQRRGEIAERGEVLVEGTADGFGDGPPRRMHGPGHALSLPRPPL